MKKKKSPPLDLPIRPGAACKECHGIGITRPMFFENPCLTCHGLGATCKETGAALEAYESTAFHNNEKAVLRAQIESLKSNQKESDHDPHKGMRGNYRMD